MATQEMLVVTKPWPSEAQLTELRAVMGMKETLTYPYSERWDFLFHVDEEQIKEFGKKLDDLPFVEAWVYVGDEESEAVYRLNEQQKRVLSYALRYFLSNIDDDIEEHLEMPEDEIRELLTSTGLTEKE